jgi:hypothetical protein
MRILLDENLDWRLERHLPDHDVKSVPRIGWAGIKNGKLLEAAAQQFEVLITMDGSIPHQQDLAKFSLIVIGLQAPTNRLRDTAPLMQEVLQILPLAKRGVMTVVPARIEIEQSVDNSP